MHRRTSRRLIVGCAAIALLSIAGGASATSIQEPSAAVAATFTLTPLQPFVQIACPYPDLYDELDIHLTGTETDASFPPHPELTGNLTVTLLTYLKAGATVSIGTVKATLTDPTGLTLYSGNGSFAGHVDPRDHVVGRGVLVATLYDAGVATDKRLIANFTIDEDLAFYTTTGEFGQTSTLPDAAIETAGTCGGG